MKNTFGMMFLITAVFVGFMMGYSVPPLLETGMIGGTGKAPAAAESEIDEKTQEHFRKLLEEK